MKTLILVRHAKSSWDHPGMADEDRPLNDRGSKDAPDMAERLRKKMKVDHFVSSPAKRARKTARYFADEFGKKKDDVHLEPELYMASVASFYKTISGLKDKYDTVAIFSHNPGITEFVNMLTEMRVDNMPTSAIFAVEAKIDSWTDFEKAEKKFLFFDTPKNHGF